MLESNPIQTGGGTAAGQPHQVHKLAVAAALFSCVGLVIGNLIGLVLAITSIRLMDRAPVRYHGYRMVFTGWFMGLIGLIVYPILLNIAYASYPDGNYAPAFANVLAAMVVLPIIMIVYAWQDLLPEERTVEGHRFLGRNNERSPLDTPLSVILLAIALATILGLEPLFQGLEIITRSLIGAAFLILALVGPVFKRRGVRVLLMFLISLYLIHIVFQMAIGSPEVLMEPTPEQDVTT